MRRRALLAASVWREQTPSFGEKFEFSIISFKGNITYYEALEGMTWRDFAESEYNNGDIQIDETQYGSYVTMGLFIVCYPGGSSVLADEIIEAIQYYT